MAELKTLDIHDIGVQVMDPSTYEEASRPRTVPTGSYRLYRREMRVQENEHGHQWLNYTVDVKDTAGDSRGTQYFSASWMTLRTPEGKLDRMSRLYGQLVKTLGLSAENSEPAKVDAAFTDAPVSGYITEYLQSLDTPPRFQNAGYTEDGGYNAATRQRLEEGWIPKNAIQSISAVKA